MIYIVPTPIGNLDDMTVRGIKVLSGAKIIFCEDGKITSKLLRLLGIENNPKYINLVRNNQFNQSGILLALSEVCSKELFEIKNIEIKIDNLNNQKQVVNNSVEQILDSSVTKSNPVKIQNYTDLQTDSDIIAIVTDAGTPGISDPAFEVIQLLQKLGLDYTVLPGATACIPAIVSSNLVSKEFIFLGFLPLKKNRQSTWNLIKVSKYPVVIYESCHRIVKLIDEIINNMTPKGQISISQEISKKNENTWIGRVSDLPQYKIREKGEFVVVLKN